MFSSPNGVRVTRGQYNRTLDTGNGKGFVEEMGQTEGGGGRGAEAGRRGAGGVSRAYRGSSIHSSLSCLLCVVVLGAFIC